MAMTDLTTEEKRAQGLAMLDEEKAKFEQEAQCIRAKMERLLKVARVLGVGIKVSLAAALLLLVLPLFIDLSFYWFAAGVALFIVLRSLFHWLEVRSRRYKEEIKAQGQHALDRLEQKRAALKAS